MLNITEGYIDNNDCKVFYKSVGEGSPILCIHGGPGLTHDYFIPHLFELANFNNRIIFFDQRGNGMSPCSINDENINIKKFTEDIELLREKLGIDKMVLLGHSMGSFFAINYAKNHPNHVSKLILSNSAPMDLDNLKKMNDNLIERTSSDSSKLNDICNSLEFKKGNSDALKNYLTILNKKSFVDESLVTDLFKDITITEKFMSNFNFINTNILNEYLKQLGSYDISSISVPTLIINSDHDFIPIEVSEYIKKRISNSEVRTIQNSGHYPFIERKQEFTKVINDFL